MLCLGFCATDTEWATTHHAQAAKALFAHNQQEVGTFFHTSVALAQPGYRARSNAPQALQGGG